MEEDTAPKPVSIRLTPEERAHLETAARGSSLSSYIRGCVFDAGFRSSPVRMPRHDERVLAQILALLGQSEIASHLRELSGSAKNGTLPVSPEIEAALVTACGHVAEIRTLLMRGLGLLEPTR